jgi:D-threonate/D-erythronate kinase
LTSRIAIIADDLTGALDASAPFAARGISTSVAVMPSGLESALVRSTQVVCVNTASREIAQDLAAERVRDVAAHLRAAGFEIAFKKVDSRLKGHIGAEIAAACAGFGLSSALIAPAVPAQGRSVRDGHIVGRGIITPISIAERVGRGISFSAPDTESAADLADVIGERQGWPERLLVGASGLSAALASMLRPQAPLRMIVPVAPLLVAIGSHDPITLEQVAHAQASLELEQRVTHDGALPDLNIGAAGQIVRAQVRRPRDRGTVMNRFAQDVAQALERGQAGALLVAGGETAQTILSKLSVDCLEVVGEALPGVAVAMARIGGREIMVLTKSGGFGTSSDITILAQAAMAKPLGRTGTGD